MFSFSEHVGFYIRLKGRVVYYFFISSTEISDETRSMCSSKIIIAPFIVMG